jgi:hypothetical protein
VTSLSVAFVVQGEGRGHMTQALALASHLRDAGHRVERVLLGSSPYRSVPEYFTTGIGAPVETFPAPTQVPDRVARGVSVGRTSVDTLRRLRPCPIVSASVGPKAKARETGPPKLSAMARGPRAVSR